MSSYSDQVDVVLKAQADRVNKHKTEPFDSPDGDGVCVCHECLFEKLQRQVLASFPEYKIHLGMKLFLVESDSTEESDPDDDDQGEAG